MFVDRDSQCTGPYADADPLAALARRWTRDARKLPATAHHLDGDCNLVVDQRQASLAVRDADGAVWEPLARALGVTEPAVRTHDWTEGLGLGL